MHPAANMHDSCRACCSAARRHLCGGCLESPSYFGGFGLGRGRSIACSAGLHPAISSNIACYAHNTPRQLACRTRLDPHSCAPLRLLGALGLQQLEAEPSTSTPWSIADPIPHPVLPCTNPHRPRQHASRCNSPNARVRLRPHFLNRTLSPLLQPRVTRSASRRLWRAAMSKWCP